MGDSPQQTLDKWKTRAYMGVAVVAACAIVWVVLRLFGVLWQAVATVVVTAIIAFMLHGVVNLLEHKGLSRSLAAAIAILGLIALVCGFFAAFVPAIAEQVASFAESVPEYARGARDIIANYSAVLPDNPVVNDLLNQATQWIQEQAGALIQAAASGIFEGVFSVGTGLLILFVAVICAYWILVDLPTISRELMSLFNEEQQKNVHVVTGAFNTAVYGWAKATLICAIIAGVSNGIAYWLMGIPYFALLGMLCGVLYFIPYIGSMVAAAVVVLLALLVSPWIAVAALVVNVVLHNVVANVISPKLMESSVNVHPAIILVAILVGGALGGIPGMLFSIPVAAAIQGVFVTFYEERTGKQLATENGALFQKPKVKYTPTWRKRKKKKQEPEE